MMIPICILKSNIQMAPIRIKIGTKKLRSLGFLQAFISPSISSSNSTISLLARMSIFSDPGGAKGPPAATLSYAFFMGPNFGITPKITSTSTTSVEIA